MLRLRQKHRNTRSSLAYDVLPQWEHRGILLHRGRWLAQSYCPSAMDDAPPTGFAKSLGWDAQLGQSKPFDVDSCVHVSVEMIATMRAIPVALLEGEFRIDPTTNVARFAGRYPSVDFDDLSTSIAGHPFQDANELREGKVGNLPSPQALHSVEIQVLDADDGIFSNKAVCQLEEPVPATVTDTLVYAPEIANRPLTVVATFLAA